jgi:hypothetical protein
VFPIAFLPRNHALAIAIMSYDGGIDYGLLGDYDALGDIDIVAEGIEDGLNELLAAARAAAQGQPPPRQRSKPAAPAAPPAAKRNGAGEQNGATLFPSSSSRPKHGPAADMRAKRTRGRQAGPKTPPRRGRDSDG